MHIWTCPYQTPQVSEWVWNFFQNPIYIISNKFCKKELPSKMHSWACPCQGPTPGAGWTPPRCTGGQGNSPDYYFYRFQQVLLKDFRSKKHSWACPCRVLPLGQGGCPPRCPGGSGNSPDCYLYHFQQVLYMWSHIESQRDPPWALEAIIFIAMI